MNDEHFDASDAAVELADLKSEVGALRRIVTTLLATLLLLTFALNALFLWQARIVRNQLSGARAEVAQYQRATVPVMDEFLTRLQRFAMAHPDFAPILGKYAPGKTNAPAGVVPR
jgi:hypothetical protein